MSIGLLARTTWEETAVFDPSGSTWSEIDTLPRGTVVVVLRRHDEPFSMEEGDEIVWPRFRVVVLTPRSMGLVWGYSLEPMGEEEQ